MSPSKDYSDNIQTFSYSQWLSTPSYPSYTVVHLPPPASPTEATFTHPTKHWFPSHPPSFVPPSTPLILLALPYSAHSLHMSRPSQHPLIYSTNTLSFHSSSSTRICNPNSLQSCHSHQTSLTIRELPNKLNAL